MLLNSEQAEYIDKLKADGFDITEEALRALLSDAGWSNDEVDEALVRFSNSSTVPIPPGGVLADTVAASNSTVVHEETSQSNNKPASKMLVVTVGGLLIVATIGLAGYFVYISPNSPVLTNETLLNTVYEKLSSIDTTNYDLKFSLGVVPREIGAKAYGDMNPISDEELEMYQRDYDRIRDITKIKNKLDDIGPRYNYSTTTPKLYPSSLAGLGLVMSDSRGQEYKYTMLEGGKDFSLEVTFETTEAFNSIKPYYSYDENYSSSGAVSSNKTVILKSKDYISGYSFKGKPSQPKLFGFFSLDEIEEYIPADISAAFFFGGSIDNQTNKPANARLHIGGEASLPDFSIAFDAEGVKKGDTYYGILNKIPTFFGDFSQLRGKWVKLTESDLRNYGLGDFYDYYIPSDENERKEEMEKAKKVLGRVLQIAVEKQVVKISSGPTEEVLGGETVTKYDVRIERENLVSFVEAVIKEIEDTDYSIGESERVELIEFLNSDDFEKTFEYLKENVKFSIWFDKKGYPIKFEQQVRFVPSEVARALKDKQIVLTLALDLSGINQSLEIEDPKEAISFDELMVEITGQTLEEITLDRQGKNVAVIRGALSSYYDWTETYPVDLSELTKKRSEVIRKEIVQVQDSYGYLYNDDYSDYLSERPFIKTLPSDVFTKGAYRYQSGVEDYELIYQIDLVPYTKDKNPNNYYTYAEDFTLESVSQFNQGNYYSRSNLLIPKYINGENIANKTSISQASKLMTDTDGDMLSDTLEKIFGTNVNNSDTDGDGYSDYEEITTASNPLGPGNLDYERRSSLFF